MMSFFVTEYTIHFDDTMAYGSHHFLTAFKFQCASREAFLFGEKIFDLPGVKEALDGIQLLTADAYSRNLSPAKLGDRVAILLSLEEWGRGSARFCYRVIGAGGQRICAGFQTLICADATTQAPIPLPAPLQQAMRAMHAIEERPATDSFRHRVLAGGSQLESLFGDTECQVAREFLSQRYPTPRVVSTGPQIATGEQGRPQPALQPGPDEVCAADVASEVWVFAGQAAFDPQLLSDRVTAYLSRYAAAQPELADCCALTADLIGGDAAALISGSAEQVRTAVKATPALSQIAIHLQNVLGAKLRQADGWQPSYLVGHSFGEIAALELGGCFDLLTGIRIVCLRVRAIAEHAPPGGGLLVVACDRSRAEMEIELLGADHVVVAGRNHDSQTLLSGPRLELDRLKDRLRNSGVSAMTIDSPTSFHHPHLRAAASHWLSELRQLQLRSPVYPVYSLIGRNMVASTDDVAAVLARQFLRPFDLQGGVQDLLQAGATTFIDCGSSGMLAGLIAKAGPAGLSVRGVEVQPFRPLPGKVECIPRPVLPAAAAAEAAKQSLGTVPAAESALANGQIPAIAIVGQGCLLPGGANTPENLFAAIAQQRLGIVDQRLFDADWSDDFYSPKLTADRSTSHLTGRVNDEDIVAPAGVDAAVFQKFTRAQQLLCVALAPCVASLVDAKRIICLIGATADGFEDQDQVSSLNLADVNPCDIEVDMRLGTARSALDTPHSAVQQVFDSLIRPGLQVTLVDAACASSLYAVSLGMQALETDQADAVIAGGVFCPGPGNSCLFSQFRGTTSTGCRPFDAHADGVVFSEGAALVTLRRRSEAERLKLPIHAIVLGAGLSSDGKSSSANVPQTRGQLLSLQRCYDNYQIDPSSIVAIEGHGTSTPVGDSTELETLRQFFEGHVQQPLPVHSLKGLLGHAGWAAGTASIIAVCQYMQQRQFPAQANHREPSAALKKSAGTLTVSRQAVPLTSSASRIAVDGFGFGGANAHLVLEACQPQARQYKAAAQLGQATQQQDAELVFVACHQELPGTGSRFFDRQAVKLPKQFIVLPELADDMDISQKLATIVTLRALEQLSNLDEELRRETSLVLALSGKTERGIQATLRIMATRFRRMLAGCSAPLELIDAAHEQAQPSGAYTLQCMMPNVAAGRAALLLDLHGANFVVDAGAASLSAALSSAGLLLHSGNQAGTQLAVVAAIDANSAGLSASAAAVHPGEYAAAFVVTTRACAQRRGLPIISSIEQALQAAGIDPRSTASDQPPIAQVQRLLAVLSAKPDRPTAAQPPSAGKKLAASEPTQPQSLTGETKIFVPCWVEKSLSAVPSNLMDRQTKAALIIVPAHCEHLGEIINEWSEVSERCLVAVVGRLPAQLAHQLPRAMSAQQIVPIDPANPSATTVALQRMREFAADTVIVIDTVHGWDRLDSLRQVAGDNSLCELLFLLAQQEVERLQDGRLELWGLCIDGWNGQAHPQSGPMAGLLKSIQREYPAARTGTICTRGLTPAAAVRSLITERTESEPEQEIVYDGQMRLVRRLRPAPCLPEASPQVKLDQHSVIVATGGAKGVTAVMLEALLRDTQCTVIALGRSPLEAGPENADAIEAERAFYACYLRENPAATAAEMKKHYEATRARWEAQHTIAHLSGLGGQIEYIQADVTDEHQMTQVIDQIVARYGRIDLLLHGAGVQKSRRLADRTLEDFRQTFSIKVAGLHNLVTACRSAVGRTVSTHVLTSAYSVFGNDGQHDYGAANETLDRLCSLPETSAGCTWTSLAWLAWNGIGMTRGSEYRALAKNRRLSGIDPEVGQRLFRDVLAGRTGSAINVPLSEAEHVEYQVKTVPQTNLTPPTRVREVGVKLAGIACLPFHKVRNTPTLPGAWILDLFVQAGRQLTSIADAATSVTVQDLSFARFVRFANNREPNLRVIAELNDNAIDLWMLADVLHSSGATLSKDVVCASARIVFSADEVQAAGLTNETANFAPHAPSVRDPYCDERPEVALSGIFECLSDIQIDSHSRRATFTAGPAQQTSVHIPALLLDAAWRVGAMYAVSGEDNVFVPVKIGRMQLPLHNAASPAASPAAAAWEIRSTAPRSENRTVRWDRTEVFDDAGLLRLVVEDALATRLI